MIELLLSQLGGWIVAALGIVGTMAGIYFTGKKSAEVKAVKREAEQREAASAAITEEIKQAADRRISSFQGLDDVQTSIARTSDDIVAERLRDEWRRD